MRVFIGSGKVTTVLRRKDDVVFSHSQIEVKDKSLILEILKQFPQGTVVINTASKINLEWCEVNREEAFNVNVNGAVNVAEACAKLGHHLVHISSGCIFDGMESEHQYTEDDEPTPAAWYTKTKTEADKSIISIGYEKFTIIRPRQLVSSIPNPTNMLTKFLNLGGGEFIESKNSMTCIEDMGEMIDNLVNKKCYGVYNVANTGWTSPYQIASVLKEKIDSNLRVTKIDYKDYVKKLEVKRVNTLLSVEKYIKATGHVPRDAAKALIWCVENYGK